MYAVPPRHVVVSRLLLRPGRRRNLLVERFPVDDQGRVPGLVDPRLLRPAGGSECGGKGLDLRVTGVEGPPGVQGQGLGRQQGRLEGVVGGGEGAECAGFNCRGMDHRTRGNVVNTDGRRCLEPSDTSRRIQKRASVDAPVLGFKVYISVLFRRMEQIRPEVGFLSPAVPPSAAVDEGEGHHEGDEEGEEAVDDVDGERGGPGPAGGQLTGVDTGEGGGGGDGGSDPLPLVPTHYGGTLLGRRLYEMETVKLNTFNKINNVKFSFYKV